MIDLSSKTDVNAIRIAWANPPLTFFEFGQALFLVVVERWFAAEQLQQAISSDDSFQTSLRCMPPL